MVAHNFTPASRDEQIVHGACRPGYRSAPPSDSDIETWIEDMKSHGIERVCCLLDDTQLKQYEGLLDRYRAEFGSENVCHAPIPDYTVVSREALHEVILPFLKAAERDSAPVVVHCSAGIGRTGHVLALWLVHGRDYSLESAIHAVRKMGRIPLEAASVNELENLC